MTFESRRARALQLLQAATADIDNEKLNLFVHYALEKRQAQLFGKTTEEHLGTQTDNKNPSGNEHRHVPSSAGESASSHSYLHQAIRDGDVSRILLALRKGEERWARPVMEMLAHDSSSSSASFMADEHIQDLEECREYLQGQKLCVPLPPPPSLVEKEKSTSSSKKKKNKQQQLQRNNNNASRDRSNSFVLETVQDQMVTPMTSASTLEHESTAPQPPPPPYSCNVTSWGRHTISLPGVALMSVACATHHTLLLSTSGTVYAMGHGKGGRLGTGDEFPRPHPVPVMDHVMAIAAAEHHSLAIKSNGRVYAFGSNGFGQTGSTTTTTSHYYHRPQLVTALVQEAASSRIVSIAAGARHSVALDEDGHIYCWGDNRAGQLGRQGNKQSDSSCRRVQHHASFCEIAAAELSTVARTRRHVVYGWGHGHSVPTKVVIPNDASCVTQMECGKYHTVAVCKDGAVYTWGWHAVGTRLSRQPQRIETPCPIAMAACSEHHTVLVATNGHVYSIGDAGKAEWQPQPQRVPNIYRAVAIAAAKDHTAVLVATARPSLPLPISSSLEDTAARVVMEHVMDLSTVMPIAIMADRMQCTSLQNYCRRFLQRNLEGVLHSAQKSDLEVYLQEQLRDQEKMPVNGDDGALSFVEKVVLACPQTEEKKRGEHLLCSLEDWITACHNLLENDPRVVKQLEDYLYFSTRGVKKSEQHCPQLRQRSDSMYGCSERCDALLASVANDEMTMSCKSSAQTTLAHLSKQVRAIRKRLSQIEKLQGSSSAPLTAEQVRKVERKSLLEADLAKLLPAVELMEDVIREFVATGEDVDEDVANEEEENAEDEGNETCLVEPAPETPVVNEPVLASERFPDQEKTMQCEETKNAPQVEKCKSEGGQSKPLRCQTCQIVCPDEKSLELHLGGRKHRNRAAQVAEEEKKVAASALLQQQQKQLLLKPPAATPAKKAPPQNAWKSPPKKSQPSARPNFKLPPPPHPIREVVDTTPPSLSSPHSNSSEKKSLKLKLPTTATASLKAMPWASAPIVTLAAQLPEKAGSAKKTLHEIMADEQKNKKTSQAHQPNKSTTKHKNPPSIGGRTLETSLGDYFVPTSPVPSANKQTAAGWVASPLPASPQPRSFREIQKEENEFEADHSYANTNGLWFIERKERAGSFHAIQRQEAEEREQERLIEEQREIERQIYEQIQREKDEAKQKQQQQSKKASNKRRKPKGRKNKKKPSPQTTSSNAAATTTNASPQKSPPTSQSHT